MSSSRQNFYTYILECADKTYYTGYTKDLEARLNQHNKGKGGRYTRARKPVKLIYHETFETRKEAMQREIQIKKMSREQKKKLF